MGGLLAGPRHRRRRAANSRSLGFSGLTAVAVMLVVVCPVTPASAGTILSSNLAVGSTSNSGVLNGQWMAAAFCTTADLVRLTDVVLDIVDEGNYYGGDVSVEIWTSQSGNAGPGAIVQSILKSPFSSAPVAITGLSLTLQPNTEYTVVVRGDVFLPMPSPGRPMPGSLTWNSVGVSTHTGDGFVAGSWYSLDSGFSWNSDSQTMKMSVSAAAPVPELGPGGLGGVAALVLGALGLLERRRPRPTAIG